MTKAGSSKLALLVLWTVNTIISFQSTNEHVVLQVSFHSMTAQFLAALPNFLRKLGPNQKRILHIPRI